jgi:hypothetical protein
MVTRLKISKKLSKRIAEQYINYNKNKSRLHIHNPHTINIKLNEYQAELVLLYTTIINHILLMIVQKKPKHLIKTTIIDLFKDIRKHNKFISKDAKDSDIERLFNFQYNKTKEIKKYMDSVLIKQHEHEFRHTSRYTSKHKGGFYFKSLEEKGDQPLTGTDLATLLDEIQQFFYNAQYTDEGKFLQDTNTVISMLRGDVQQFKGILQYRIFPKYYTMYPPFLNFANIKKDLIEEKKWEDLPDYLLAYQSYLRSRDEYLVNKGLKSPSVLNKDLYTGFFNKVANSLDTNIQKFQQYRNKSQGKLFPISLPP